MTTHREIAALAHEARDHAMECGALVMQGLAALENVRDTLEATRKALCDRREQKTTRQAYLAGAFFSSAEAPKVFCRLGAHGGK